MNTEKELALLSNIAIISLFFSLSSRILENRTQLIAKKAENELMKKQSKGKSAKPVVVTKPKPSAHLKPAPKVKPDTCSKEKAVVSQKDKPISSQKEKPVSSQKEKPQNATKIKKAEEPDTVSKSSSIKSNATPSININEKSSKQVRNLLSLVTNNY